MKFGFEVGGWRGPAGTIPEDIVGVVVGVGRGVRGCNSFIKEAEGWEVILLCR